MSTITYTDSTTYSDGTVVGEVMHADHIDVIAQAPGRHMITMTVQAYTELAYSQQERHAAAHDKARLAALTGSFADLIG